MPNAIEINGLCKSYKDNKALKNFELSVKEGEILGLLGANGAGKSTLMSILNYLSKKDSGEVKILGLELAKNEKSIKLSSSLVPQSIALYPMLNAYENLEYFGALQGIDGCELKNKIDFAVSAVEFDEHMHKKARELSGGLKRRLNLAVGLLNNPKILYLDEPTVGVDPHSRSYILDVIKKINRELHTTIIYTSHYMDEVEQISDEIALMDGGVVVMKGSKEEIVQKGLELKGQKGALEELFLSLTQKPSEEFA